MWPFDQDFHLLLNIAIGGTFLSENCTLNLPECTVLSHPEDIDKSSKLKPNFSGPWPNVEMKDGSISDFREIQPKSYRSLDMAYFTDLS